MHAKVTIADDVVFAGSFNLSRSGETNAENVLEIADPRLADQLAAYIDAVRARYPDAPPPRSADAPRGAPSDHESRSRRVVGDEQQLEVARGDDALAPAAARAIQSTGRASTPSRPARPGSARILRVWISDERLEQLVERAEAAREDHERRSRSARTSPCA